MSDHRFDVRRIRDRADAGMTTVPMTRLDFGPMEFEAAQRVLQSGQLTQGSEVSEFEREYAAFVGSPYAAAVSSGTTALYLGLLASGVGPGDEVIVPSFTFAATANAVALTGAKPVFADIEPQSMCLDPESARAKVSDRTVALVAVHLFGRIAPMRELGAIARQNSLLMVEDAAQAHGAALGTTRVGAIGDIAAFSFYATKNMTTGEGGMVTCRDPAVDRRVRLLRNQGMLEPYRNEVVGINGRMTEIAAAVGRVQLSRLPEFNARRKENAREYLAQLRGVGLPDADGEDHVVHQFTIRSESREDLAKRLAREGIESRVFYPVPVHRLRAFASREPLPMTEAACRTVLSLPVAPHVERSQIAQICEVICER